MPTFAENWKYNPQKRKSDYEKNDAITGLLRYADNCNGRQDLAIEHHLHRWNRSNPDIEIKQRSVFGKK
jgi:hypothetical protein